MYNLNYKLMKVKLVLVIVLTLVAVVLLAFLVWPNLITKNTDDTIKPDLASHTLKYTSKDYGIKFEYLSEYEVSEAPASKIYDSNEAVVYTFVNTEKSFVAPVKILVYSFSQQDSVDSLLEKIKVDFPSVKSYTCKKSTETNQCVYLTSEGDKQLPFHFITKSSKGLDASFVDMPQNDYHIGEDYVLFPEPAKTFHETAERI